jgi:phosphohistidine phosphatase SixA
MLLLRLAAPLFALMLMGASPPAANVYVMRHLQKGAGSDPSLTAEGAANARRLADWFAKNDPPAAIFVSTARRAQETAAPLADLIDVEPTVYDPRDSRALVEMVRQEEGTVLIVGHSNTVPEIVALLGGKRPADIAEDRFGDIYRVRGGVVTKMVVGE